MITLFCVRPTGFNIGNDTIFLGVRHLLREAFAEPINIVQVPALGGDTADGLGGLSVKTLHQMNLYGHGVVVGGGNLYENGGLHVDAHALRALRLPLMLLSLSHGRVYDHRHQLVPRTDAMPSPSVIALNERAGWSVARDDATLDYLRAQGIQKAAIGGCPSLLVSRLPLPLAASDAKASAGTLLSIRNPKLMSVPLRDEARLHGTLLRLIDTLEADGFGPVRLLCHDTRDLMFASSLGDVEYIVPDDVYSYLELLRQARLVVSFRLHAFVPCLSFGTPAVNISYDERSLSLVRTLGFESWDIDFVRSADVVAAVRDRCARLDDFHTLRAGARPLWAGLESVTRHAVNDFASAVRAVLDRTALITDEEGAPMRTDLRSALSALVITVAAATLPMHAQKIAKESITSGGKPRTYYSFMPEGSDKVPLIVLLHGSGRDGTTLIEPWQSLAKKERLALVAPDATVKQFWNIGNDGPAFLRDLVEAVRNTGRIDGRRIYLFGHSAGGHHSIDMGLLESEYFAAVAVHAGALTHDQDLMVAHADRKIPIAMWNGTDDRVVAVEAVRQVRDYLVGKGFDAKLTELRGHTHDYYSRASDINKSVWGFLKEHTLAADPKYKEYVMGK